MDAGGASWRVREARPGDRRGLEALLRRTIEVAFGEAGIQDPRELRDEVKAKLGLLECGLGGAGLAGDGSRGWFVAVRDSAVLGVLAFHPPSAFVSEHVAPWLGGSARALPEVGVAYVNPQHQGRGGRASAPGRGLGKTRSAGNRAICPRCRPAACGGLLAAQAR